MEAVATLVGWLLRASWQASVVVGVGAGHPGADRSKAPGPAALRLVVAGFVHGFIRPRLLVPPGLLRALSPEELRFIFLHELAHLQRHDIAVGWLPAALQALHWFNPVIWLAFLRMRADRELAADELALWCAKPKENRAYAETIIKLLEACSGRITVPTLVGILEDRSQMTRRIRQIARFGTTRKWLAISFFIMLIVALVGLTDGKSARSGPRPQGSTVPKEE